MPDPYTGVSRSGEYPRRVLPDGYPTADAYEAACRALEKHRARAGKAEAEIRQWEATYGGSALRDATTVLVELGRYRRAVAELLALHSPPPGWERVWKDPAEALERGWPECAGCSTGLTFTTMAKCRTRKVIEAVLPVPSPHVAEFLVAAAQNPTDPTHLDTVEDIRQWADGKDAS